MTDSPYAGIITELRALGWAPAHTLKEGLRETYDSIAENSV